MPTRRPAPRSLALAVTLLAACAVPVSAAEEVAAAAEAVAPGRLELDVPRLAVDPHREMDLAFPEPTSSRTVYDAIGDAFGLDVVFDPAYAGDEVTVERRGADVGTALDVLATAAGDFWRPLDDRTVLVADDTPQKRREHELHVFAAWRLQHVDVAEATTLVRALFAARNVAPMEDTATLAVRDTAAKVALIDALLARLDRPQDEVTVAVEVLELAAATRPALATDGSIVDPATIAAWRDGGDARSLLRTRLGLLGRRPGILDVRGRQGEERLAAFEAEVRGRVDRVSRDVQLDVRLALSVVAAPGARPDGGVVDEPRIETLRSSWRVGDGRTLVVELPDGPLSTGQGRWLAVALTPTVTRLGTADDVTAFAIGTEVNPSPPSGR